MGWNVEAILYFHLNILDPKRLAPFSYGDDDVFSDGDCSSMCSDSGQLWSSISKWQWKFFNKKCKFLLSKMTII